MQSKRTIREIERKDRLDQMKHNRKMRRMERNAQRKKNGNSMLWVWEFSKKMVQVCAVIYVVMFVYACVAMWRFFDFTYLGTLISETSDILKTCVFGYFIKAGLENVFKIWSSSKCDTEDSPAADELEAPDGEEWKE